MQETDYQVLFENCLSQEELVRELALVKLQQIIYLFPVKRFKATWDVAGDFYLFVQNQLENLLQGYQKKQNQISFQVYLSVRLRSLFHNFLRRRKTKRDPLTEPIEWDEAMTLSVAQPEWSSQSKIIAELHKALASLDFLEKTTLKLYYALPLTLGEVRDLVRLRGSLKGVFTNYRAYLLEQQKAQKKLEKLITQVDKYLIKINSKLTQETDKLNAQQKHQEKLKNLLPFVGQVKMGTIAAVLGEHQSTTSRRLKTAENKLKRILSKNLGIAITE